MSRNKVIFITIVIIGWIVLFFNSQYPDNKYQNVDTPIEGNYLSY